MFLYYITIYIYYTSIYNISMDSYVFNSYTLLLYAAESICISVYIYISYL